MKIWRGNVKIWSVKVKIFFPKVKIFFWKVKIFIWKWRFWVEKWRFFVQKCRFQWKSEDPHWIFPLFLSRSCVFQRFSYFIDPKFTKFFDFPTFSYFFYLDPLDFNTFFSRALWFSKIFLKNLLGILKNCTGKMPRARGWDHSLGPLPGGIFFWFWFGRVEFCMVLCVWLGLAGPVLDQIGWPCPSYGLACLTAWFVFLLAWLCWLGCLGCLGCLGFPAWLDLVKRFCGPGLFWCVSGCCWLELHALSCNPA